MGVQEQCASLHLVVNKSESKSKIIRSSVKVKINSIFNMLCKCEGSCYNMKIELVTYIDTLTVVGHELTEKVLDSTVQIISGGYSTFALSEKSFNPHIESQYFSEWKRKRD